MYHQEAGVILNWCFLVAVAFHIPWTLFGVGVLAGNICNTYHRATRHFDWRRSGLGFGCYVLIRAT